MIFHFYNLDTPVEGFFENTRVINVLHKNEIYNLYDLYKCNISNVVNTEACGNKTKEIIEETFYSLENIARKKEDLINIKIKYQSLMNDEIVVSKNSDKNELRHPIKFESLINLYENFDLSDRDIINCNMIFQFLNIYEGNSPLDYISPETSRFNSYKEAYKYLNQILENTNSKSAEIFRASNGIFQKKQTLEEVGKKYGISKQRVQQINKKTVKKIYSEFDTIKTKIVNTFNKDYYIPLTNPMLRVYCEYLYERGLIEQDKIFDEKVYVRSSKLVEKVNNIISVLEEKNVFSDIDDISLLKLFEKKYLIKERKILKNSTLTNYVPLVMEELGRAVNLNSDYDVNLIYEKLEDEYDVYTEYKDSRNIERVLNETCILIAPRTYILDKYQKKTDMTEVFHYIDKCEVTNAQNIYSQFINLWNSIDIYSHVGVYGYLKYYYPNNYNYAGRSFLINVIGKSTSWGEIVINMIKERNAPVTFQMVNDKYPALTNMIWINLEANFTDLFFWGDNSYYCSSLLKISSEDMNFITVYIYNNGPVAEKNLYMYILDNRKNIIEDNYIYSEKQLLKFIKIIFGNAINYDSELKSYYI